MQPSIGTGLQSQATKYEPRYAAKFDDLAASARRALASALREAVESGRVVDQFLWDERDWGTAEAGGFTHFHAAPAAEHLWTRRDLTAEQAMAARREDRRHLARAVGEMDRDALRRAVGMLRAGELSRGPLRHRPLGIMAD